MKILITGKNGQLGQELCHVSVNHPEHTYCFTDRTALDLSHEQQVRDYFAQHHFDIVINTAGYTAVDAAEQESQLAMNINGAAMITLAQEVAKQQAHLIHISTDYVFGNTSCTPYTEDFAPLNPLSIYGKSKWEGEKAIARYATHASILRTSWLYSPYKRNFVKTMLALGRERKEISVVFDQIGTPTYALDLANAIFTMLNHLQKGISIYHYANEGVCSWYDFARKIMEIAQLPCHVKPILSSEYPTPAVRPTFSVMDKQKFKRTFSTTIPHWEDALRDCLSRILSQ